MCMEHSVICKCGRKNAGFNFKNEIMSAEVIELLYCPECSQNITYKPETMVRDNGWIIQCDMDVAELYSKELPFQDRQCLSPEMLFDKGYVYQEGYLSR